MQNASRLQAFIAAQPDLEAFPDGATGLIVFRPTSRRVDAFFAALPKGLASLATINADKWLRCVCANPNADMDRIIGAIDETRRRIGP
jgi:L-2,4-diaminobutyrate decarboxylase